MTNRLFVALQIPEAVKNQIFDLRESIVNDSKLKWEPSEKIHLTLKFLGDFPVDQISEIKSDIEFLSEYHSLKCILTKFDFFYRDKVPSILWAGLEIEETINEIVKKLNETFKKHSIPAEEKRFKPHLTLLRIKRNVEAGFVSSFKNFTFKPILFKANTITLYKSELNKFGSKYYELQNYKLKELEG